MSKKRWLIFIGFLIIFVCIFLMLILIDNNIDASFKVQRNEYNKIFIDITSFTVNEDGVLLNQLLSSIDQNKMKEQLNLLKDNIDRMQNTTNSEVEIAKLKQYKTWCNDIQFIYDNLNQIDELSLDVRRDITIRIGLLYGARKNILEEK